jgi:hypothetical protein
MHPNPSPMPVSQAQLEEIRRAAGFSVTPVTSNPGYFLVSSRATSYFVQVMYQ